jgi:hypothetical protein
VYGLNSIQLGETNGFRVAGRFRVLNEIITAICKLTAVLFFIVLSDLCHIPDLLCVMVHYQTGSYSCKLGCILLFGGFRGEVAGQTRESETTPGVTHRRQCIIVRFEVFTAVTMKNVVFWDVALCRSCFNQHLEPPAHAGSPLADFSTLKMEAIRSSETSVNAISIQRHIPEDDILRCIIVFLMLDSHLKAEIRFVLSHVFIFPYLKINEAIGDWRKLRKSIFYLSLFLLLALEA